MLFTMKHWIPIKFFLDHALNNAEVKAPTNGVIDLESVFLLATRLQQVLALLAQMSSLSTLTGQTGFPLKPLIKIDYRLVLINKHQNG